MRRKEGCRCDECGQPFDHAQVKSGPGPLLHDEVWARIGRSNVIYESRKLVR